jgi:hypothetical protein
MKRVRGIGGVFFKSENPEALRAWYARHLGIVSEGDAGTMFAWTQPDSPSQDNCTAWCIFPSTTAYFGESKAGSMVNYVVDDLHATLKALREEVSGWTRRSTNTTTEDLAGSWTRTATASSCGNLCRKSSCRWPLHACSRPYLVCIGTTTAFPLQDRMK